MRLCLPYPRPPKIWCIGLNYRSHAEDIDAVQPEEPGSFMKPTSALFEPGGAIDLPPLELSNEVDADVGNDFVAVTNVVAAKDAVFLGEDGFDTFDNNRVRAGEKLEIKGFERFV